MLNYQRVAELVCSKERVLTSNWLPTPTGRTGADSQQKTPGAVLGAQEATPEPKEKAKEVVYKGVHSLGAWVVFTWFDSITTSDIGITGIFTWFESISSPKYWEYRDLRQCPALFER